MTAETQTTKTFRREQTKFILFSAITYAFFYLTRKNLSMAQPAMLDEGVVSMYALGTMMTVHGMIYGLSRFVNGFWADRLNGRIFMAVGLGVAAVLNLLFGFCQPFAACLGLNATALAVMFGALWMLNGWVQGTGFPPCAKMLTHWIHPKELSTKMSIWNTSHSFGAVMALGLCSLLLGPCGLNWRWCFWVPAALAAGVAVFCFLCLRESPTEAGLPELDLEVPDARREDGTVRALTTRDRLRLVFRNPVIWCVCIANFFVYVVRFGFLDWGPTFLRDLKHIPVAKGGMMIICFELAAVVGTVFAGWISDRVFKGRGVRTCAFCMLFAALFSFAFWYLPDGAPVWQATLLLMGAGFFIYGPQALVGIVAANQATKEAAAMANGFTGITGYASTAVSGFGVAVIKEHFGWGPTLAFFGAFALAGMLLFLCAWNASATGYKEKKG